MPAFLLIAGFLMISAAWLWSNPLGAAPDEEAHYIKAVGVSQLQLVGEWVPIERGSADVRAWQWVQETTRAISVPASLDPPAFSACYANRPTVSAACMDSERAPGTAARIMTYVAVYQPYPYVLPALLLRLASDPWRALFLARVGVGVMSLTMLTLAILTLWQGRRSALGLVGLMVAASPMLVYLSVVLSPSGVEVTSALCFLAGLIRLRGNPPGPPSWLVVCTLACGGFMLATARPLGPLWVLLAVAASVFMPRQFPRDRDIVFQPRTITAGIAVLLGVALSVGWGMGIHQHPIASLPDAVQSIGLAVRTVPYVLVEQVAWFGWLDTRLPDAFYVVWFAAFALLLVAAIKVGSWRERLVLLALAASAYLVMVAVAAALTIPVGTYGQGRYTMPFTLSVPLWAAEILYRHRAEMGPRVRRALPSLVGLIMPLGQLVAWWGNARRYAIGSSGSWLFLPGPVQWQPPLGWWPWVALAVVGAACCVSGLLMGSVDRPPDNRLRRIGTT